MATPTIKTKAGQLYQTAPDELGQLTQKAGLPNAPITPGGAASLGANPDQAKMTGASAQKQTSLREALQAGQSLADRQKQTPQQPTQQSAEVQQAKQYQGLTSFDDRVQKIQDQIAAGPAATQKVYDETKVTSNPGLSAALSKLNQNPNDTGALTSAASALGMNAADITSGALAAKLKEYSAPVTNLTPVVTPSLFRADDWKAMGFTDINDFAAKLGIPVSRALSMSLDDIKGAISGVAQTKFGSADSLRAILNDPFASPAAKKDAQAQLAQMGASGAATAEASLKDVTREAQKAQDFADTPEALKKANQAAFDAKQQQAQAGLTAAGQIQAQKLAQADLGDGVKLDDSVMKKLDPSWGQVSDKVTKTPSPLIQDLQTNKTLSPEAKAGIATTLKTISDLGNQGWLQAASKMTGAQLQSVIGSNPQQFISRIQKASQIQSLPSTSTPDTVATSLGFSNEKELVKAMGDAKIMQTSGFFGDVDPALQALQGEVVIGQDGKLNVLQTLNRMKAKLPGSLSNVNIWTNPAEMKDQLGTYSSQAANQEKVEAKAQQIFGTTVSVPDTLKTIPKTSVTLSNPATGKFPILTDSRIAPGTKEWDNMAALKDKGWAELSTDKKTLDTWYKKGLDSITKYKNTPAYDSLVKQLDNKKVELQGPITDKENFMKAQQAIFDKKSDMINAGMVKKQGLTVYFKATNLDTFPDEEKVITNYLKKYGAL